MVRLYADISAKALGLFTVARSYQYGPSAAGQPCTLDILKAVSDHAGLGKVRAVISLCPVDQPGFWFAAIAAILRDMRTIIDSLYSAAMVNHGVCHLLMDFLELCLGNHSSIDHGLICDQNNLIAIER